MAQPSSTAPLEILRKYWRHNAFRPPQDRIIQTVLEGHDCLALLPTGGGKSVCFQVPALAMDGICLVVSPLIALMEDQIRQLKQREIPCAVIHSGLSYSQLDTVLDNCVFGNVKLLYLSPERIQTELFQERLKRMKVSMVAVDEAHCISEWGYDFRPPYLKIGTIREIHPHVPILALTASATDRVRKDITEKLGMKKPEVISRSFARDNISFVVREAENKDLQMVAILRKVEGSAIVYVRSRKATEELAAFLRRQGISATWYHAGLTHEERNKRQASWIANQERVMVATNAFGMGIDKSDVRVVIHTGLPESLEAYYQEAGRAGRDGLRSYAVLLHFSHDDVELEKKVIDSQPEPAFLKHIYQCLANYYQIAEGAGQGHSVEFDLGDFTARYDLRPSLAHAALRRLEEQGLIAMNDRFHKPSRLHIAGDRAQLYEFQVAHERFDPVIHATLRLYGAELFTEEVVISEAAIAQALRCKTSEAKALLNQLNGLQILRYDEASDKPRITWLVPRQDAQRLMLDIKALTTRK
ncbi:MAG: RecQ family ATP-dependent DNA helicase, partial [Bacteroidota bacterium]